MNRIFHQRFTVLAKCSILFLAALCLYCFWHKMAIEGAVVMAVLIGAVERILHTTYTITDDELIIYRGRFSKPRQIRIEAITRFQKMRPLLETSYYLLVHYAIDKMVAVQPENCDDFIQEIQKRQKK